MAVRSRLLSGVALAVAIAGVCQYAFIAVSTPPTSQRGAVVGRTTSSSQIPEQKASASAVTSAAALIAGAAGTLAVASASARRGSSDAKLRSRVSARVAGNAPSLIQVLEQKKLLSFAENNRLLSKAESAGISADLPEKLGLLVLAERLGLLSLAETIVTNPGTPGALLAGSATLSALTFFDVTGGEDLGFLQWVLAGALGSVALVLLGAGLVIGGLTSGVRRTKNLDIEEKRVSFDESTRGFEQVTQTRSATLLQSLEEKQLLSAVENNGLLSLGKQLLGRPLTVTEQLGVLGQLEKLGLLSEIESQACDQSSGFKYIALSTPFLLAALASLSSPLGIFGALIAAAPSVALIAFGAVIGALNPSRSVAFSEQ